jgi:hypothetical protein
MPSGRAWPDRIARRVDPAAPRSTHELKDGPFSEAKEVIGGYWLIQVKSKEEAVEWASRCPGEDCTIEVRQVFEMSDFPPDVQEVAR